MYETRKLDDGMVGLLLCVRLLVAMSSEVAEGGGSTIDREQKKSYVAAAFLQISTRPHTCYVSLGASAVDMM